MLKKFLNPFGLKVTSASSLFVGVGTVVSVLLHIAFYGAVIHFVLKYW